MIEIRPIGEENQQDLNLPNEPFPLFGRMIPRYNGRDWDHTAERFETVSEMCFPDEHYDYDEMAKTCRFLGAYDGEACVGLAILQRPFFKYATTVRDRSLPLEGKVASGVSRKPDDG